MRRLIQRLLHAIYSADWWFDGERMVRFRNGRLEKRKATAEEIDEANIFQAYRF